MHTVFIEPTFDAWRDQARALLATAMHPNDVLWAEHGTEVSLFPSGETTAPTPGTGPKVSAAFLGIARTAAAHTDPQRWAMLYRLLWRLTHGGERHLLAMPTDPDVRTVQGWCHAVGRDIHKMHAFVRFRQVGIDPATGREQFVAWFEPEHRIIRLTAAFFQRRFAAMDWSILTPDECVHWDGETLHFTPGVPRSAAPDADALDGLWRSYYRSIFNPARLKVKAMQSEMPRKYWRNLPEAEVIPELISRSRERVEGMMATEARPAKAAPRNAYLERLRRMNGQPPE
jgi:probable DNA metabolism protein